MYRKTTSTYMTRTHQVEASPKSLMEDARQKIDQLGIGDSVSPETWVVAYTNPHNLDSIESGVLQLHVLNDFALGDPRNLIGPPVPIPEYATRITDERAGYINRATQGSIRKALAVGALAGTTAGFFATIGIGETKDAIREGSGIKPDHVTGEIFEGNSLTAENFMTFSVGDKQVTIPDIRTLSYGEIVQYETREVVEGLVTSDTSSQLAKNPFADDLQLTGLEGAIDRVVATDMLEKIAGPELSVTFAEVHGIASDDFNGKLGVLDPEQAPLAKARAEVAAAALEMVAEEQGIALPEPLTVTSGESVISEGDVAAIEETLVASGITMKDALDRYNTGQELPADIKALLDKHIQRGATYEIGYETTVTSSEYELQPAGTGDDSWKPWMSFSLFGGGIGYLTAMYSAVARLARAPRRGSKLARKDIKKSIKAKQKN